METLPRAGMITKWASIEWLIQRIEMCISAVNAFARVLHQPQLLSRQTHKHYEGTTQNMFGVIHSNCESNASYKYTWPMQ